MPYIGVRGFPARGYFIHGRDGGGLVAGNSSVSLSRDRAGGGDRGMSAVLLR